MYDATNEDDLFECVDGIQDYVSPICYPEILARATVAGLYTIVDENVRKLIEYLPTDEGKVQALITISMIDLPAFKKAWQDALDHITHGTDTEQTDSVGGFSQRELDLFQEIVNEVSRKWHS